MSEPIDYKVRASAFRDGAAAVVAENDRMLWATKPGRHWAADLLIRMAETSDAVHAMGALPMPVVPEPEALSAEWLAEVEARADAATEGPWCTDSWEIYQGTEYVPGISFWIGETCRGTSELGQDRADAAFVAAARSDVPALVAEVRRLNEVLSDAAEALRANAERFETVRSLCDAADHVGIVSGGWFTVDAVRRAAAGQSLPESNGAVRRVAAVQSLRSEDEFGLRHSYRLSHDLPESGGVQ